MSSTIKTQKQPVIMLAAGGTGGHVFPAESLARELTKRGAKVVFVTDKRGKNYQNNIDNVKNYVITASSMGKGILGKISTLFKLGLGTLQSLALILRYRPSAIVGFGGYAAASPTIAGAITLRPILLHEQNVLLGRTNRKLLPFAKILACGFPEIENLPQRPIQLIQTGNPIRPEIAALRDQPYPFINEKSPINILITGGSQGAALFAEIIPPAMQLLPDEIRHRIHLNQQTHEKDIEKLKETYNYLGIESELKPFFNNMPELINDCHLTIGRAGAASIAEPTTAGRPAILVPLPHSMDDHQTHNAKALEKAGGGWHFPQKDFIPETLAKLLRTLLDKPEKLQIAATKAKNWGITNAASNLADAVINMAGIELTAPKTPIKKAEKTPPSQKNKKNNKNNKNKKVAA